MSVWLPVYHWQIRILSLRPPNLELRLSSGGLQWLHVVITEPGTLSTWLCSNRLTLALFKIISGILQNKSREKFRFFRGKSFVPPIIPIMAVHRGMVSWRRWLSVWGSKLKQAARQPLTDAVRDDNAQWIFSFGSNSQWGAEPGWQRLAAASSSLQGETRFCLITSVWWTAVVLQGSFPQCELGRANVVIR